MLYNNSKNKFYYQHFFLLKTYFVAFNSLPPSFIFYKGLQTYHGLLFVRLMQRLLGGVLGLRVERLPSSIDSLLLRRFRTLPSPVPRFPESPVSGAVPNLSDNILLDVRLVES